LDDSAITPLARQQKQTPALRMLPSVIGGPEKQLFVTIVARTQVHLRATN
jgi:hypothetical protein